MIVITTHLNADFDCLASMVAALRLYPGATLVFPGSQEKSVREYLQNPGVAVPWRRLRGFDINAVKTLVVVDASSLERIGPFAQAALNPDVETHIYDHHPQRAADIPHTRAVIRPRGATTTVFTELLRERGLELSPGEATLLMMGLYEDTGSLTYVSVTPEDFDAARWLLSQGADVTQVAARLAHEMSAAQVELLDALLKGLARRVAGGVDVAVAHATAPGYVADLSVVASKLMDMENPDALFAIARMEDRLHLVARSRVEALDAGRVAERMGGGGHPTAGSATIRDKTLPQAVEALWAALEEALEQPLRARDLMTTHPITLDIAGTAAQAAALMTRFDIGAVPVLREGAVEGIITRAIVEKALFHGMGDRPAAEFMLTEFESVTLDTPARRIEELVLGQRQKLTPVVDGAGRLVGLVTRGMVLGKLYGDSLKKPAALSGERRAPMRRDAHGIMREVLPSASMDLLGHAAAAADELGATVYVAGGFVRDLLLRAPSVDIDLVVEGDGIAVAHRLAARLGGRAHPHEKFKTAVVTLPDGRKLDVATARIEYYAHPAALPTVELSAIRNDLYRRDFSINAMAIQLNARHPWALIDFFGGQTDLKNHALRVLHTLSFVEDPTRAFRGVRFEWRFGFEMGKQTLALLKNAVRNELFHRLSTERIMGELILILKERRPSGALRRLRELDLLRFFHPALGFGAEAERLFERAEDVLAWNALTFPDPPVERWRVLLMTLFGGLAAEKPDDIRKLFGASRKALGKTCADMLSALALLKATRGKPLPSQLHRALERRSREAALYFAALAPDPARAAVTGYLAAARAPARLTGADLVEMGAPPSALVGEILRQVRAAQLDGQISTREEAISLARRLAGLDGRNGQEPGPGSNTLSS